MKSPTATTMIMGVLAAACSAVAAYFYPWPEIDTTADRINTLLFEEYDYDKVRSIKLVSFDRDRNELESFELRRRGEKWIMPRHGNFVASAPEQISKAVDSLKDRTILELMTDQQQDHVEFGVVEPTEFQSTANRSSLGTRMVLEDRNGKEIASLIIGKSQKNDPSETKRFVRVPGQPQVYVIEFDQTAIATNFEDWVDPNLMNLATVNNTTGFKPLAARIDSYRVDPAGIKNNVRDQKYRAVIGLKDRFEVKLIKAPKETSGVAITGASLEKVRATPRHTNQLMQLLQYLGNIQFFDVRRKDKDLASVLASPRKSHPQEKFTELNRFGFHRAGFEDGGYVFNSTGGQITVSTQEGIIMEMMIGKLLDASETNSEQLSRYVIFQGRVNQELFPEPEKPEGVEEDSEENKAYLRALADRTKKLDFAKKLAKDFNKTHANWYYVVDDRVIEALRPELSFTQPNAPESLTPANRGNMVELPTQQEDQ